MRVSVVTTSYPSGGEDPSGHFVEAEVRELERAGHAVTVIRPAVSPRGAFGWPGVATRVRENPLRLFDACAWTAAAATQLRRSRPDRIAAHWCVPSAWPIAAAVDRDVSLEVVSHGGDVRLLTRMPRLARERIVRSVLQRAQVWRFVSAELRDSLTSALTPRDAVALRERSVVAPSPLGMIDVKDAVRARRDQFPDRRLYVCAGRLVASKRVDRVIDYVASSRNGHDPVLVVLGDGPERSRLEKIARAWKLDVRFQGTTPRHETLAWIGAADEVVHASRSEGLSTVVREAEQLGVPVTRL
jgi:glycosyltransferase involved in cell wall biosynthesis